MTRVQPANQSSSQKHSKPLQQTPAEGEQELGQRNQQQPETHCQKHSQGKSDTQAEKTLDANRHPLRQEARERPRAAAGCLLSQEEAAPPRALPETLSGTQPEIASDTLPGESARHTAGEADILPGTPRERVEEGGHRLWRRGWK